MARQHFYAESLGSSSTTNDSSSAALQVELAWQPDANSDYFVFASCSFNNSSSTDNHVGTVELFDVNASTALATQSQQTKELSSPIDWFPFVTIAKLSYGSSPAAQSLRVIFYSSNSGDTTQCRDARICAIKAAAADQYAETLAQTSYTSSTPATRTTLTFTPGSSGDYLVIAAAELTGDVNGQGFVGRLVHSGVATYAARSMYCKDDFDMLAFFYAIKKTALSGSQTFTLQYNSITNGQTNYIQNARILALRLDGFDNNYSAQTTPGSPGSITNQTSYQDTASSLTATPVAAPHLIIGNFDWNPNSTTISGYAEFHNGSQVQEWDRESPNASSYVHTGFCQIAELAAASTTWKWRVKTEGNFTLNYYDQGVHILELGPYTKTASFDAAVRKAIAATASANGAVRATIAATVGANVAAQLVRTLTASLDVMADLGATTVTADAAFDAAVRRAISAAAGADAAVRGGVVTSASLDVAARVLATVQAQHDAAVRKSLSAGVGANGAAQTAFVTSASLDAVAQVLASAQAQLDAAVLKSLSAGVGASVAVQTAFVASASLDAAAQALRTASAAFDAAAQVTGSATLGADVRVVAVGGGVAEAALDAAVSTIAQASVALAAAVRASRLAVVGGDAALVAAVSRAVAATVAVTSALSVGLSIDAAVSARRSAIAGCDAPVQWRALAAIGCDCLAASNSNPILTVTALLGSRHGATALTATRSGDAALSGERSHTSDLDGKVN